MYFLQVEYFVRTRLTQLVSAELQGPIVRQSLVAGGLCLALSLINRYLKEREGRKVEPFQNSNFNYHWRVALVPDKSKYSTGLTKIGTIFGKKYCKKMYPKIFLGVVSKLEVLKIWEFLFISYPHI